MSQTSEDTRAHSLWNRTPGKPNSSFNCINKEMSNISHSTDSGVGRTPNWDTDIDCKIGLMDSNPWSNNNVFQSPESVDSSKILSWDESNSKISNNLTFGFSSQWSVGNNIAISTSNNPTWDLSSVSPSGFMSDESIKVNNCWNLTSSQSDNYLPTSSSIWSSNPIRQFPDQKSDKNTTTASDTDLSVSSKHYQILESNKSIFTTVSKSDTEKYDMPLISAFNNVDADEKIVKSQSWAETADKGLSPSSISDDEPNEVNREINEEYQTIINRLDGWGSNSVDQSTPWMVEDDDPMVLNACPSDISVIPSQRSRSVTTESNVWTNEPPNGVGVWESHYENIGEKTSRWNNVGAIVKTKIDWESPETVVIGQWGDRDCDSSVWSVVNNPTETRANSAWVATQEQQNLVTPIGSGSSAHKQQSFPTQWNSNALISVSSDMPESLNCQSFYQNQTATQSNTNIKMRPIMNLGPRIDDSSNNNNTAIDINRAMTQSNIVSQRNDRNNGPGNYRVNGGEMDTFLMARKQPVQSISGDNGTQAMMSSMESQRMVSDNQMMHEKQIMKEINQLQSKQQELMHRIVALRSISGSQAIIQEMTRTLGEVHQQLSTQQTTLSVIRNHQMAHGNGRGMGHGGPPNGHHNQSTTLISDMSQQMIDMKIQKRSMDMWSPQSNLPSQKPASPYPGVDKSSWPMFHNPANQINGPIMTQSLNSYNKALHSANFLPSQSLHRQSGLVWPDKPSMGMSLHNIDSSHPHNDYSDSSTGYHLSANFPRESRPASSIIAATNATTADLSLPQTLSSGNTVSSAFTGRDIAFAPTNISEFVPGQPWPGSGSYSQRDNHIARGLLSVTNHHLDTLGNSNNVATGYNNTNNGYMDRLPSGTNGVVNCGQMNRTYVLIRDLPSHINIEMLRNVLTSQNFPGLIQMRPNLVERWVLLHFSSNEDTLQAFKNLYRKVGVVELVPDHEVSQCIQYSNSNVSTVIPCSDVADYQQQHTPSQYLH